MKPTWWRWGYVPVIAVLGLIWYEFWQSGALTAPPRRPPEVQTVDPGNDVAPVNPVQIVTGGPTVGVGPGPVPGGPRVNPAGPATIGVVAAPAPVMDDAFFANPPPISLSCKNASIEQVVAALRDSFKMPSYIQFDPNNGSIGQANFNLDVSNKPFWEVMRLIQGQAPLGFMMAGNGSTQGPGLVLAAGSPVYRFEANGPVILFATQATYMRSGSGQRNPGDSGSQSFNLSMGAAVEPRILVARPLGLDVLEATDENGRALAARGGSPGSSSVPSNYFQATVTIPTTEPMPRRLNMKCQLRIGAQLPTGSVTFEDASQKVGEPIVLGDRQFRLSMFDVQGGTVRLMISMENGAGGSALNCAISDSSGRTSNITLSPNSQSSIGLGSPMSPPYRLVVRDPTVMRELTYVFEFKDLALP